MRRKRPPSVADSSGTKGPYSCTVRGNAFFASLLTGNQEIEEPEVACNALTSEVVKSARQSSVLSNLAGRVEDEPKPSSLIVIIHLLGSHGDSPWDHHPSSDVATPGRDGTVC
jgi:hypothetical protein